MPSPPLECGSSQDTVMESADTLLISGCDGGDAILFWCLGTITGDSKNGPRPNLFSAETLNM